MGKFTGVLLASDYDNTLLDTESARRSGGEAPRVSERNQAALRYFMEQGGRFAVATGRALAALEHFVDEIPMNAPAIICNGAALYDFSAREYLDYILLNRDLCRRCQEAAAGLSHHCGGGIPPAGERDSRRPAQRLYPPA